MERFEEGNMQAWKLKQLKQEYTPCNVSVQFQLKLFTLFIPFKLAYGMELTINIEYEVMTFCMIKWHQLQVEEC
jgi:hypothetical protein